MVDVHELGQAGVEHRRHAVVHDARHALVILRRPVLPLRADEDVPGAREGRPPTPAVLPRVPADVIDVQVGADDQIHRLGRHAGRSKVVEERRLQHVKRRSSAAILPVADAGVDEDREARTTHDERVHALEKATLLVDEVGREPGAMLLERLRGRVGQEPGRARRAGSFDDARDGKAAEREGDHARDSRQDGTCRQGAASLQKAEPDDRVGDGRHDGRHTAHSQQERGAIMAIHAITDLAIVLKPEDDVAIAKREIAAGTILEDGGTRIDVRQDIRPGHKVARRARRQGAEVRRYGQVIGFATQDIAAGDHVHTQNLAVGELERNYEIGTDVRPVEYYPADRMRFFDGYKREDGRVGTRNYVAIISGVNCSASVSQFVKDKFRDVSAQYPNIDGVLAITHKSGCGTKLFGEDHLALQRVLAGYAKHPNVAAYILIGLGCEVNQAAVMVDKQRMAAPGHPERKPVIVNIQEAGGIRKTVDRAAAEVAKLLPIVNEARRTPQPVSELVLATNCGGSDGNSGITANPALGWAVDELVRYGGTGVLAETPEIYGAEHLLIRRAVSEGVAKKLIDRYKWWEWYCRGIEAMDNNPAPGNKAGGITTVFEKSLGGVTKGGTTPMTDVFLYGEPITTRGFVFMDTPGHDPVSITGLVAGGCNIICFTTGRGSVFGCKPVPSIKLATNSLMYRHMEEDMDVNCGVILEGTPLPDVGRQILDEVIAVASGKRSKSELSGVGEEEFAPWIIGPVM